MHDLGRPEIHSHPRDISLRHQRTSAIFQARIKLEELGTAKHSCFNVRKTQSSVDWFTQTVSHLNSSKFTMSIAISWPYGHIPHCSIVDIFVYNKCPKWRIFDANPREMIKHRGKSCNLNVFVDIQIVTHAWYLPCV